MFGDPEKAAKVKGIFQKYDHQGQGKIKREELASVLSMLGIEGHASVLDTVSKGDQGELFYADFVDKLFGVPVQQVSIYSAQPGDEVAVPLASQDGVIMERTTTDVKMKLPDGYELWFDIEDVEGGPVIIHEVPHGGVAKVRGGARGEVKERTTTDIKLRFPNGSEVWHAVEDLETEAVGSPHGLATGSKARVARKALRGNVKQRTTTDALVVLENGVEAWRGIDELAPIAAAPSEDAIVRLRQIFEQCDTSRDDSINKRELIKVCRSDSNIADFFGLPSNIRQEDGSREQMERLFQAVDTDSDRQLSWTEFRKFFLDCMSGRNGAASGSAPALALTGAQLALVN